MRTVAFKVSEEEYEEMRQFAEKHYNGNLSACIRTLYTSGRDDLRLVEQSGLLHLVKLCKLLNPVYQLRLLRKAV